MAIKILFIEDEALLRKTMNSKLTKEGFEVLEAENGDIGYKVALEQKPELILLDILMPQLDGMQFLKRLRQDKWGKNARVMILTNLSDPQKTEEAMAHEVYDYLVKSDWTLDNIVSKIKDRLKN